MAKPTAEMADPGKLSNRIAVPPWDAAVVRIALLARRCRAGIKKNAQSSSDCLEADVAEINIERAHLGAARGRRKPSTA